MMNHNGWNDVTPAAMQLLEELWHLKTSWLHNRTYKVIKSVIFCEGGLLWGKVGLVLSWTGPDPFLNGGNSSCSAASRMIGVTSHLSNSPLQSGRSIQTASASCCCRPSTPHRLFLKGNSGIFKPRPYFCHEIRSSTHREQFGESRRPSEDI